MTDLTGRELDMAVAEAKGYPQNLLPCPDGVDNCVGHAAGDWRAIPRYSTDWAAAGPLLEEMAAAEVKYLTAANDNGYWICVVQAPTEEPYGEMRLFGPSGPEAIARAFVEWRKHDALTAEQWDVRTGA